MQYAVITGVSKGLGEAAAVNLMEKGIHVLGISRSGNDQLPSVAEKNHVSYDHYTCDIGDLSALEQTFQQISEAVFGQEVSKLYLVNNAAVIDPVDQSMNIKAEDLDYHIKVNATAPMVFMNKFLYKADQESVPFVGVTVTSGAAERPIYGWSAYCSTKASINMYTETAALEQDQLNTKNKVIAFSPGIMDTPMQGRIRESSESEFADVETFKGYKENNLLKDPSIVGKVLVDILTDEKLKNGKIYYVNEYV
ncbi:(S)-benzoin forming benzil reductase [Virgibacillus kimchii]